MSRFLTSVAHVGKKFLIFQNDLKSEVSLSDLVYLWLKMAMSQRPAVAWVWKEFHTDSFGKIMVDNIHKTTEKPQATNENSKTYKLNLCIR